MITKNQLRAFSPELYEFWLYAHNKVGCTFAEFIHEHKITMRTLRNEFAIHFLTIGNEFYYPVL